MSTATELGDSAAPAAVAVFDARPFFEKALQFGIQTKILDATRLDLIAADGPKGLVQIARYFGSEFLRPELERARERMVNLVSLCLELESRGDLRCAAESLRDHSFLSRSKSGSDMLKALIAMPSNSHFGMNENAGFTDEHIPLLAKWSLKSLADYQAELAQRSQSEAVLEAAIWLADELGMDESELQEAACDGEAVIRTALLALSAKSLKISKMPDWVAFEKLILALRKKPFDVKMPAQLPKALQAVVASVQQSVLADWPKLTDTALPARKLFQQTPAFVGRYFWVEDSLAEIDHFDRSVSEAWHKATGGHDDEGSLLTLFLTLAAGGPAKTLLTERAAGTLVRKIRKNQKSAPTSAHSFKPEIASNFIRDHAPAEHQADYAELWQSFLDEGLATLQSDFDYELNDALALLRRECNLK
jgi:hypothetical protein